MKIYKGYIAFLQKDEVFVFTSNKSGYHGAGSAGYATFNEVGNVWRKYQYDEQPDGTKGKWNVKGVAEGPMQGLIGKSYAIPTVTRAGVKRSIPLEQIKQSVEKMYACARKNPHLKFFVAQENKTGLNGYRPWEMAEVYSGQIPDNVYFEESFALLLTKTE